jgi:hypothetical protein
MCAITDVNTLPWNNAEETAVTSDPEEFPHAPFLVPLTSAGASPLKPRVYHQLGSPLELRDSLRNEINRGKEYLLQVQNELRQNREWLEQWAQYEVTCSLQPLDHLVQSVWLKSRVEQFLVGWLRRKQKKLSMVLRKIESMPGNHSLRHTRAVGRQGKKPARKPAKG